MKGFGRFLSEFFSVQVGSQTFQWLTESSWLLGLDRLPLSLSQTLCFFMSLTFLPCKIGLQFLLNSSLWLKG